MGVKGEAPSCNGQGGVDQLLLVPFIFQKILAPQALAEG